MTTQASDTDIRTDIRALLAQHRFDAQRVQMRISGGIVRVSGELIYVGNQYLGNVSGAVVDVFERAIKRLRGVKRAHFQLDNWRRLSTGEWEPVVLKRVPIAQPAT